MLLSEVSGSTLAIPHSCPPRWNKELLGKIGKLPQDSQRHQDYRHTGRRDGKNIYCPVGGTLTVRTDVLSRLLLLTLKSMTINIHLLLATQHPVLSLRKDFPDGNHGLGSVLQSTYITGLVTQSACSVRYQKVFLKTCFQFPIPLSKSIHITSDPRVKKYFRKVRAKTEASVSPERDKKDQ